MEKRTPADHTAEEEIRNLSEYISSSIESALKEVITEELLTVEDTKKEYKRKEMRNRQEKWQNKALHGQYLKDTFWKTDCEITWNHLDHWLKNGYLKKEMEGFIMTAQDQAIRINAIKAKRDKAVSDSKCRLCKVKEETIDLLVSSCSKIAQTDYKQWHNKVASMLHWSICRKYNLPTAEKWWEHIVDKGFTKGGR